MNNVLYLEYRVESDGDPSYTINYQGPDEDKAWEIYRQQKSIAGWGSRIYSRWVSEKQLLARK